MKKSIIILIAMFFFAESLYATPAEIPAQSKNSTTPNEAKIKIGGEIRIRGAIQNSSDYFNNKNSYSNGNSNAGTTKELQRSKH